MHISKKVDMMTDGKVNTPFATSLSTFALDEEVRPPYTSLCEYRISTCLEGFLYDGRLLLVLVRSIIVARLGKSICEKPNMDVGSFELL